MVLEDAPTPLVNNKNNATIANPDELKDDNENAWSQERSKPLQFSGNVIILLGCAAMMVLKPRHFHLPIDG